MDAIERPSTSSGSGVYTKGSEGPELSSSDIELSSVLPLMAAVSIAYEENTEALPHSPSELNAIKSEIPLNCADAGTNTGTDTDITDISIETMITKALEGMKINSIADDQILINAACKPNQSNLSNDTVSQRNHFLTFCNNCQGVDEISYLCTVCADFSLCLCCYQKNGHLHKMEKLDLDFESRNSKLVTRLPFERFVHQAVTHAFQCQDACCRKSTCAKYKLLMKHDKLCKDNTGKSCYLRKQFITSCRCHARYCQDTKCVIPFCSNIKYKVRLQQVQERRQEALLSRRMAAVNFTPCLKPEPVEGKVVEEEIKGDLHALLPAELGVTSLQNNFATVTSGTTAPNYQGGMVHKQALQQLRQAQRSPKSPDQQMQILQILKTNPQLMTAFVRHRKMQRQVQAQLGDGLKEDGSPYVTSNTGRTTDGGNMTVKHVLQQRMQTSGSPQSPDQQRQTFQTAKPNRHQLPTAFARQRQIQPAQARLCNMLMRNGFELVTPGTGRTTNRGNMIVNRGNMIMISSHTLQQLRKTVRSPYYPDQQTQILQILKSNPQLVPVYIQLQGQQYMLRHQQFSAHQNRTIVVNNVRRHILQDFSRIGNCGAAFNKYSY